MRKQLTDPNGPEQSYSRLNRHKTTTNVKYVSTVRNNKKKKKNFIEPPPMLIADKFKEMHLCQEQTSTARRHVDG